MQKILIVENSVAMAHLIASNIKAKLEDVELTIVHSLEQARSAIQQEQDWLVSVVCLSLSDAPNGEVVDCMRSHNIPVIILTATMCNEVRELMLSKQVIDYIVKRNRSEIENVAKLVKRIRVNRNTSVLIADDSPSEREFIRQLLEVHQFTVLEAKNGQEALNILKQNPQIRIVITDYEMPLMNGVELLEKIREQWPRDQIAVIGLSASNKKNLSAALLKAGANDYIKKPFIVEEFYCRLVQNVELLEQIQVIKDASNRDHLTKLYNRRYLFDEGELLFQKAKLGEITLHAAMLDIDHFKGINDNHGHQVGDTTLRNIANILQSNMPDDCLIARYGGEEFCMLLPGNKFSNNSAIFENLRERIEKTPIPANGQNIFVTTSIGVSRDLGNSLEGLLNHADNLLYQAKNKGRNRVVLAA